MVALLVLNSLLNFNACMGGRQTGSNQREVTRFCELFLHDSLSAQTLRARSAHQEPAFQIKRKRSSVVGRGCGCEYQGTTVAFVGLSW